MSSPQLKAWGNVDFYFLKSTLCPENSSSQAIQDALSQTMNEHVSNKTKSYVLIQGNDLL